MSDGADQGRSAKARRILLASIHDVGPRFESEVDQLVDRVEAHVGTGRFAMLVVPDHWGEAPLPQSPAFAARLRRWADNGVEMFLHGWSHRDDSAHADARAAWKAKHMTAGEGEFLGLSEAEATRRCARGAKWSRMRSAARSRDSSPPPGSMAPARMRRSGMNIFRSPRIICRCGIPRAATS